MYIHIRNTITIDKCKKRWQISCMQRCNPGLTQKALKRCAVRDMGGFLREGVLIGCQSEFGRGTVFSASKGLYSGSSGGEGPTHFG